jgi:hypothetical protein
MRPWSSAMDNRGWSDNFAKSLASWLDAETVDFPFGLTPHRFSKRVAFSLITWSNLVQSTFKAYVVPFGNQTSEPFDTSRVPCTKPSRFMRNRTSAFPSARCGILKETSRFAMLAPDAFSFVEIAQRGCQTQQLLIKSTPPDPRRARAIRAHPNRPPRRQAFRSFIDSVKYVRHATALRYRGELSNDDSADNGFSMADRRLALFHPGTRRRRGPVFLPATKAR